MIPIGIPSRAESHNVELERLKESLTIRKISPGGGQDCPGAEGILKFMSEVGISSRGIGLHRRDTVHRLLERIHRYTGHASPSTMQKAFKAYELETPMMYLNNVVKECKGCLTSRKNQQSYKLCEKTSDMITCYVDITEPKTTRGFQGAKYIIIFVEDGDESLYAEVLNRRADALLSIINYLNDNPHVNK